MIEMIQRPRIETEELSNDNTYGRFMVEPLERGFGTTLGNSLRRVLLSSQISTVFGPSQCNLAMRPLMFRTISVTSSLTPGIELNS